jgi:hypothetical protein
MEQTSIPTPSNEKKFSSPFAIRLNRPRLGLSHQKKISLDKLAEAFFLSNTGRTLGKFERLSEKA